MKTCMVSRPGQRIQILYDPDTRVFTKNSLCIKPAKTRYPIRGRRSGALRKQAVQQVGKDLLPLAPEYIVRPGCFQKCFPKAAGLRPSCQDIRGIPKLLHAIPFDLRDQGLQKMLVFGVTAKADHRGLKVPDDLGQTQPVAMVDLRQIAPSLQRPRQIEKPRILPVQADLCLQPDITKQDLLFHLKRNPHHPVFLLKRQKRIHDPVAESPGGIAA